MTAAEPSQTNWQISKDSLRERNKHMFNNTLISDVSFSVKDSNTDRQQSLIIPAHKYILAISSPVFFAMFYGQTPDTSDTVKLPDCDSDSFLELLRFLYCDEVKLTGSNVFQVLYLAKKYMIPSLSDDCTKFLRENLDATNVFSVLQEAQLYEEVGLVDKCLEKIDETSEEAMSTEAFLDVSHDLLKAVLERDSLNASEVDIFKAVDCWVEHQCKKTQRQVTGEEKRTILGDAINLIRFPLMTQEEFASVASTTNLLPQKEILDIFFHFNNALPSPLKFSNVGRRYRKCTMRRIKRFDSVNAPSDSWHYKDNKCDAVAFSVNSDVSVCGVRLCGCQGGSYSVTIGIYHKEVKMTEEVGKFDTDENEANDYGFDVLFTKAAAVKKNELYEIRAVIDGPASYYGREGKKQVPDDEITFTFSNAKSSPNGTDVVGGQFPEILFG